MKLFDIKVHTSDREYNVTLRNLTIIRASQIVHRISVASKTLLRSIKRFLVPGKVVIAPLIKIRSIKFMKQRAEVAIDALPLVGSRKRITADEAARIDADNHVSSMKKIQDSQTWRVIANAMFGTKKSMAERSSLFVDADIRIQKVRKRRLGELGFVRLADLDSMTFDELDYVAED